MTGINNAYSQEGAQINGYLHFPSVVDTYSSTTHSAVTIPLFIKDHPIPVRKPKVSEISTIASSDQAGFDTRVQVIFFGAPEPLQLSLTGWIITPTNPTLGSQNVWLPTNDGTATGTSLFTEVGAVSYGDMISAYIEGRMKRNSKGKWQRVDPDYYIDPFGNKYSSLVILAWECSFVKPAKKQTFSMTIYLESGMNA